MVGAATTMGVIVGADIPMMLGAMIVGPLGGWCMKKIDEALEEKIPVGFEMLYNTFSAGILAVFLILIANVAIGPVVVSLSNAAGAAVDWLVNARLLPLAAIIIEQLSCHRLCHRPRSTRFIRLASGCASSVQTRRCHARAYRLLGLRIVRARHRHAAGVYVGLQVTVVVRPDAVLVADCPVESAIFPTEEAVAVIEHTALDVFAHRTVRSVMGSARH